MGSIIDYLEHTACRTPEAVAVADGTDELTFYTLRRRAYGLGQLLCDRGMTGAAVGIYAQRSVHVIAAMLACAAAGCPYVPLDPNAPEEKLRKILTHAEVKLILGFSAREYNGADLGCEYLRADGAGEQDAPPAVTVTERDTLYIIYTSGSTGEPKGIPKRHGAVMNFVEAYEKALGFSREEILGNQTPFCFDASAKDIYLMLKTGARMEIIPSEKFAFPVTLIEYLNEKKITFISWVPSALAIVARLHTFRDILPVTLRRVCFVGEVFPRKDLDEWRRALPEIEYINLYGQSELAGVCCLYPLPKEGPVPDPLPLGKPLENSRIWLYDDGKISREMGELLIESGALAEGYLKNPEKTAETFLQLELDGKPRRVLRSGDWARYDGAGNLVFLSRADDQIKYKGYRIELGEIEAAVNALSFIGRACCLYNRERERITVFCTTDREELKLRELNEALAGTLADYMLPRRLVVLPEMPLNANGKIDRVRLKSML